MGNVNPETTAPAAALPLRDALARLTALPPAPIVTERVALRDALGRMLADDLRSPWPLPRFDQAAMDGWAVRLDGLTSQGDSPLSVTGRVLAGEDASALRVGEGAIRIFTGAMVPPDAQAVVPQEHARQEGGQVWLPSREALRAGQHIRRAGEQARAGALTLKAGRCLTPMDLALAAGCGQARLPLRAGLRVGLLSTGNELRPPGSALGPADIPDQNGVMLGALLRRSSVAVTDLGHVPDDGGAVAAALRASAVDHDLLITSGGASVGEADHLRAILGSAGGLLFARVALKPGRPTLLGLIDPERGGGPAPSDAVRRVPVLALPGTPSAALVAFAVIGRPLLRHLRGEPPVPPEPVRSMFDFEPQPGVTLALPVALATVRSRTVASRMDTTAGLLAALATGGALVLIDGTRGRIVAGDTLPAIRLND